MKLIVNKDKIRLDVYLAEVTELSRSKIKTLIEKEQILVNNEIENPSYIVHIEDEIDILDTLQEDTNIKPEKMDLDIIFEDDDLLVINKASGIVVHPAVGNYSHTLVNGLIYYFNKLSNKNSVRPGIVHRLDKDTSGLMIVAKNDYIHEKLSDMMKERKVEKHYLALVWGLVKHDRGTIDAPIGRDINNRQKYTVTNVNSKDSITHFNVIERYKDTTLIECKLETGRTHQLRVHLNYIGHPIVNDPVYGNKKIISNYGQMLHSKSIKFIHPKTKVELYFEVEPPKEFTDILNTLKD